MRLAFLLGDEYGRRVVGNLINYSTFCQACGHACDYCRTSYGSYASDIVYVHEFPPGLPAFIDDPLEYMPELPRCDVVLAVGLHHDLLLATPEVAEEAGAKAVMAPIEDPRWIPPGLRRQVKEELEERGLEHAFPKPFCTLEPTGQPAIDSFIQRYRIGKPLLEIELAGGYIASVTVLRSAPCGETWYLAQRIKWKKINPREELYDVIAKAHHTYPCTASMEVDPEIGEPILHEGGYVAREAVEKAIEEALKRRQRT